MDTRQDFADDVDRPSTPSLAGLEASVERSAAEIAAGKSVPFGPVLKRLRESADRIRRERAAIGQALTPKA